MNSTVESSVNKHSRCFRDSLSKLVKTVVTHRNRPKFRALRHGPRELARLSGQDPLVGWGQLGLQCLQNLVRVLAAALVANITAVNAPVEYPPFIWRKTTYSGYKSRLPAIGSS